MIDLAGEPSFVTTHSGKTVSLPTPKEEEIDLEDIIFSHTRMPRWCGQFSLASTKWTIANHCCLVLRLMQKYKIHGLEVEALLHDASEAYLADIPSPVKRFLPDYKKLEKVVQGVINSKFNIQENPIVKSFDKLSCFYEAVAFTRNVDWIPSSFLIETDVMLLEVMKAQQMDFRSELISFLWLRKDLLSDASQSTWTLEEESN